MFLAEQISYGVVNQISNWRWVPSDAQHFVRRSTLATVVRVGRPRVAIHRPEKIDTTTMDSGMTISISYIFNRHENRLSGLTA
jgi:hypothetical protein